MSKIYSKIDLSICIPTYNGEKYLAQAIESVLAQNFNGSLEILIVDDGSSDNTVKIAREYAYKNTLIRIHMNKRNLGLVGNWNECIRQAKGEWVQFLFQDDFFAFGYLSSMHSFAQHNNLNLVLCDRQYIYEKEASKEQKKFLEHKLLKLADFYEKNTILNYKDVCRIWHNHFLGTNFLGEPIAGMFKKSITKKIGYFDINLRQMCDLEFWLRIGLNYGLGFIPEKLVNFRVHGSSTTSKNSGSFTYIYDRLIIGKSLLKSEHYQKYREYALEIGDNVENLYVNAISKYTKGDQYFKLKKYLPPEADSPFYRKHYPGMVKELLYKARLLKSYF